MDFSFLREIVAEYGTPVFVLDEEKLRQSCRDFTVAFKRVIPTASVAYSYKTNYLPRVCQIVHEEGLWAEVVSGLELYLAKTLGVPGKNIVFNGPWKSDEDLKFAIHYGVAVINVDSFDELKRIRKIARNAETFNLGVRLAFHVRGVPTWAKFGLEIESGAALKALKAAAQIRGARVIAIHCHLGSDICDPMVYAQAASRLVQFARDVKELLGLKLRYADLGGGFASQVRQRPISPAVYARAIADPFVEGLRTYDLEQMELVLEPGRSIVAHSMLLITRVISVKENFGKFWIIVDSGTNLIPSIRPDRQPIIQLSTRPFRRTFGKVNVAGPLCTQADILRIGVQMALPRSGDLLVLPSVGAYSISMANQFMYPRAPVVAVSGNSKRLVATKETCSQVLERYKLKPANRG